MPAIDRQRKRDERRRPQPDQPAKEREHEGAI
jgi:hypothetical protein